MSFNPKVAAGGNLGNWQVFTFFLQGSMQSKDTLPAFDLLPSSVHFSFSKNPLVAEFAPSMSCWASCSLHRQ